MIRGKINVIAYLRVSTGKQAESGLGLEAQRAAIQKYVDENSCKTLAEYVETESGKNCQRVEFDKAVKHAKRTNAVLVIGKLDRLARNVHFTSGLMESGVDFVACDMPFADKFTIHILAAVAEREAELISQRTKAALARYKARGGQLGGSLPQCRNLSPADRERGAMNAGQANRRRADDRVKDIMHELLTWRDAEGLTYQQIADRLNERGEVGARGNSYSPTTVMNCINRARRLQREALKEKQAQLK